MNVFFYVVLGMILVGYLAFRAFKKATGTPLLRVKIGAHSASVYNVEFEKIHPETKDIEYVRLLLNFIAKILFVIERSHDYVSDEIIEFMNDVVETTMTPSEVLQNIPDELAIEEKPADGKVIEGVLYFKDAGTRTIMTRLTVTWYEYQLAHSVMALTKVVVEKLDDFHRTILKDSMQYMVRTYNLTDIDPRNMSTMASLPNEAFVFRNA